MSVRRAPEERRDAGAEVREKLARAAEEAGRRELRTVRCPRCGFRLLDVYGRDHCYLRVKCRKCKFGETIDTALFRTAGRTGGA